MACHIHVHLLLHSVILIVSFSPLISGYDRLLTEKPTGSGFRVSMIHRDSLDPTVKNLTYFQRVERAIKRSRNRQLQIESIIANKDAQTPVDNAGGDYLASLAVGTPSVNLQAILDTGSDLVWTQCQPCTQCTQQNTPIFDPSKSSTYSQADCSDTLCQTLTQSCSSTCQYTYAYGGGSQTQGTFSYDTWALGDNSRFSHVGFGCGNDNSGFSGTAGILGVGRGPLSFITQLGSQIQSRFAYCLVTAADVSKSSPLFFGASADLGPEASNVPYAQTDPSGTYYYVPVEGFSVGGTLVDIPANALEIQPDGSGGVIVDSGTTLTLLADDIYQPLKKAFQAAINLPQADTGNSDYDLCFDAGSTQVQLPSLIIHFKGSVNWGIPTSNYFVEDTNGGNICLTIMNNSGVQGVSPSILGNILQQNFQILYDNSANIFAFKPATCESL